VYFICLIFGPFFVWQISESQTKINIEMESKKTFAKVHVSNNLTFVFGFAPLKKRTAEA